MFVFTFVNGQTFLHPTTGLLSSFAGGCPEHTCSGFYYDDGGASNPYSTGVNSIYQTFCPDQDDVCMQVTFTEFETRNSSFASRIAQLAVRNGPAQNSPLITAIAGNASAFVPLVYTSSHSSGCLTFSFYSGVNSQNFGPYSGWASTLSCVPCTEREPNGLSECINAQQICNNDPLSGNSPGPGSSGEGCAGCLLGETFTSWYYFEASTSGTLGFSLTPDLGTSDFDFALYGPNVGCSSLGSPVRCSYAQGTGNTGLNSTALDTSEGVSGDGFVSEVNVNAGDQYVLMIDNWTAGGGGYTINWTGTASLECASVPLPVEFLGFQGEDNPGFNELSWSTNSERDNDFFRVERSTDGYLWHPIADVKGSGTTNAEQSYSIQDANIENNIIYYYRLKQFDFDGKMETHDDIVAILNNHAKPHIVKVINTLGQEVSTDATGLIFEIYSDGSRVKKFNP